MPPKTQLRFSDFFTKSMTHLTDEVGDGGGEMGDSGGGECGDGVTVHTDASLNSQVQDMDTGDHVADGASGSDSGSQAGSQPVSNVA